MTYAWRPMTDYPGCDLPSCTDANCDWGPKVILEVGGKPFVGWREAGYWLTHDPDVPSCVIEFDEAPTRFSDFPSTEKETSE